MIWGTTIFGNIHLELILEHPSSPEVGRGQKFLNRIQTVKKSPSFNIAAINGMKKIYISTAPSWCSWTYPPEIILSKAPSE